MLEELSKDKPDEIVYENFSTLLLMIGYECIDLNKYSEEINYRIKNIPEKNYNDVKADFLILDNLPDHYFKFNEFKGNRELIKIGQKVTFYSIDFYDENKQVNKKNAINIKPIITNKL
jgi:hypothetical protein